MNVGLSCLLSVIKANFDTFDERLSIAENLLI